MRYRATSGSGVASGVQCYAAGGGALQSFTANAPQQYMTLPVSGTTTFAEPSRLTVRCSTFTSNVEVVGFNSALLVATRVGSLTAQTG